MFVLFSPLEVYEFCEIDGASPYPFIVLIIFPIQSVRIYEVTIFRDK